MRLPVIGTLDTRLWGAWAPGPEEAAAGPVVVSLTNFTMHTLRDLPGIWRAAIRLRRGWYGLPGAVGLYLWADAPSRQVGSVSVWTNEPDLHRWIGVPLHVAIMRRYRTRGFLRSAKWFSATVDRTAIRTEAARRLEAGDYS
jgi:heme-degrading monooxygenase HmoA